MYSFALYAYIYVYIKNFIHIRYSIHTDTIYISRHVNTEYYCVRLYNKNTLNGWDLSNANVTYMICACWKCLCLWLFGLLSPMDIYFNKITTILFPSNRYSMWTHTQQVTQSEQKYINLFDFYYFGCAWHGVHAYMGYKHARSCAYGYR